MDPTHNSIVLGAHAVHAIERVDPTVYTVERVGPIHKVIALTRSVLHGIERVGSPHTVRFLTPHHALKCNGRESRGTLCFLVALEFVLTP